jgi:hypothetical protein
VLWRRTPRVTPEQVLRSRPVRNQGVTTEETDEGGLRVIAARREAWWVRLLNLVLPIPRERVFELDEVGREIWQLCDGERTLEELIGAFVDRHKLTRAEAEWSLRTYLRDLGKRGLVGFAVEKAEENE